MYKSLKSMTLFFITILSFPLSAQIEEVRSDKDMLEHFESIPYKVEAIYEIDSEISRYIDSFYGKKPIYSKETIDKLLVIRGKHCALEYNKCFELKNWEKLICNNNQLEFRSMLHPYWQSVVDLTRNQKDLAQVWGKIKESKAPCVCQLDIAKIALNRSVENHWHDVALDIARWVKLNIVVLSKDTSVPDTALRNSTALRPSEQAIVVYSDLLYSMEHWKPSPMLLSKSLADTASLWLQRLSPPPTSDTSEELAAALTHAWYRIGARSKVLPFVDKMKKQYSADQLYSRPWFAIDYCRSARDTGKIKLCADMLVQARSNRSDLYLDIEVGINFIKSGELVKAISYFEKLLQAAERKQPDSKKWIYMHLASAEYAHGQYSAAQTHLDHFFDEIKKDRRGMWVATGEMMELKILGAKGKFLEASQKIIRIRNFYRSFITGPFVDALNAEFANLINSFREKNRTAISSSIEAMNLRLFKDSSQDFYKICIAIAKKKLEGKPITSDLVDLEKARGKADPDYREFISVVNNI
jgi:tetratricopeptide (TPR) repeat protein